MPEDKEGCAGHRASDCGNVERKVLEHDLKYSSLLLSDWTKYSASTLVKGICHSGVAFRREGKRMIPWRVKCKGREMAPGPQGKGYVSHQFQNSLLLNSHFSKRTGSSLSWPTFTERRYLPSTVLGTGDKKKKGSQPARGSGSWGSPEGEAELGAAGASKDFVKGKIL